MVGGGGGVKSLIRVGGSRNDGAPADIAGAFAVGLPAALRALAAAVAATVDAVAAQAVACREFQVMALRGQG